MIELELGGCIPIYIGFPDRNAVAFDQNGLMITQIMSDPSAREIAAAQASARAEFRFGVFDGLLVMTFKLDDQPWQEAIYSPCVGEKPDLPTIEPDSGLGLALTFVQVNSRDGCITALRLIGLGEKFSRSLIAATSLLLDSPLSLPEYDVRITKLQERYTTQDFVSLSRHYCKIR